MRKFVLFFCLLASVFCLPAHAAIYTGGSGSGWSYGQATPPVYHGGSGDGDTMTAFNTDTAVGYGTATQLVFTTSPANSYAGAVFDTQPIVEVRDANSNKVANATDTINLSINNDPVGSSTLGGTTSMAAVSGIANFSGKGLYVSRAGTGFTLSAASGSLDADTSSSFNILSPVRITSPNGGEVWTVTTANNIAWTTYGSLVTGTNTVEYSLNNGETFSTVTTNAGSSPYSWVTPSNTSTQALVRVTNSADSTYTDTSDAVFNLLAGFSLIAPNGGETWANDFNHTIAWSTTGTVANVKLEYSADGGTAWTTIVASTSNAGTYSWTPSVSAGGTNYKVRISDASNANSNDVSSSAFTIQKISVTAPTSGQRILAGSSANITWTSSGISNVKLEYSVDSGAWTQITGAESLTASTGSYSWTVPTDFNVSTNVRVRISSTAADSDGNTASVTSSTFTIYGQLTLTDPTGGEEWAANASHDITWTTDRGTINNVKLEYSDDNFVTDVNTITASTSNAGTYSWTPTSTGSTFKIRISDVNDSSTSSTSASYFSITGIGITAPSTGATWNCGSSQTITWNYTGSFNYVKLEYYDGSSWNTIISSAPNIGSYTWTVPNTATNAAQIRVTNTSDISIFATSGVFNIKSVLAVTAPNGGETLSVGSSTSITWTTAGTVSDVKLEYYNGTSWGTIIDSTSNSGTYSWTVPDAITSSAKVRVTDMDSGHPSSSDESDAAFTISSALAITAPGSGANWAVGETHDITWTNTGTVSQIRLYYASEKDNYAAWTEITSGATANSNTYSWTIPDIILAVGNDPQTSPTLGVKIKVTDATSGHPETPTTSSAFNVIYYTITFTVKDSQTQANLSNLSVNCSSGWSASSLTSGISTAHKYHYGTYTTIWSRTDYTDSSVDWTADSSKTVAVTMTLSAVAGQEYHVYSNFTYDAASDSFKINSWLEKSGTIITGPTNCTVRMYDKDGNTIDINGTSSGTDLTSTSVDANGVFRQSWDLTNINRNTSYFGKVQVAYLGATYSSNVTYVITVPTVTTVQEVSTLTAPVSAIQTSVGTGLNAAVSAISSSVGSNLGTQVSNLQTDVSSVKTAVGASESTTLYSKVTDILQDTGTTIPDTIVSELKKGPRSKILNRPTSINTGDTVTISYQTDTGKSPTITVYDAGNTMRVSSATMTEIGTSGVYEYDVAFSTNWGTGDFTILCAESTTSSVDSMIINVSTGGTLASLDAKINTLTTTLNSVNTNVSSIKTIIGTTSDAATASTLYGKLSGVSSNVDTMITKWGSYSVSDIIGYVDSLETYLGTPNDGTGQLTVFGKVANMAGETKDISTILSLANKAYDETQNLRKEIDFRGKSNTAYTMLENLDKTISDIKETLPQVVTTSTEAQLREVAESVKETKAALQKTASEAGLKGIAQGEPGGPATMESLQNQLTQLKALVETVKAVVESKQEPVVKTWFEQGEQK